MMMHSCVTLRQILLGEMNLWLNLIG